MRRCWRSVLRGEAVWVVDLLGIQGDGVLLVLLDRGGMQCTPFEGHTYIAVTHVSMSLKILGGCLYLFICDI